MVSACCEERAQIALSPRCMQDATGHPAVAHVFRTAIHPRITFDHRCSVMPSVYISGGKQLHTSRAISSYVMNIYSCMALMHGRAVVVIYVCWDLQRVYRARVNPTP